MAQKNLIGKTILGYSVTEKIGSGAFGTVYKAVKTNASGQYVRALKHITIPTEKQYISVLNSMGGDVSKADSYFSKMLNNIVSEIKILNALSESNARHIVRYYESDIITTDAPRRYDVFILMEYLTPLDEYVNSNDFFVRDVIKLGLDVLYGLKSCHDNNVIHRDVKDENIFISDSGEYKIGDFGVSKVLKDSSKAESLKGTPNFLAPEVYLGKEGYTKSVDLYSLGIVLYRLLNYNRNPFLPPFPEQYFSQDEDDAFEKRMSGKVPDPPALGGEEIGRVIIKAVSRSTDRFHTADEFITAFEIAINNTPPELFAERIQIAKSSYANLRDIRNQQQYGTTIGEIAPQSALEETPEASGSASLNKHLFDSIGEVLYTKIPEPSPSEESKRMKDKRNTENSNPSDTNNRVADIAPPDIDEPSDPDPLDRRVINKFIFLIPIAIILIGIIAYFVIMPNLYGKVISFIDWLFDDPQNIVETLRDSDAILAQVNSIIGMKIFWCVWLAGLIASLFFVGKHLQSKPEPNTSNAILTMKEPYLMIQDVTATLKQLKTRRNSNQLDSLIYSVKKLEEKLSVESDFGYGKHAVINCENSIARQIQFLLDTAPYIENGNFEENLNAMNKAIININSLLRRRTDLKKR